LSGGSTRLLGTPKVGENDTEEQRLAYSQSRSQLVDTFVVACFVTDVVCFGLICGKMTCAWWLAVVFIVWRMVDLLATAVRVSLFDEFDKRTERYVYSTPIRPVVLGIMNYVELVVCFAAVYAINPGLILSSDKDLSWLVSPSVERPLHLSFMTQLTVGYGDLYPDHWLRPVTWLQGCAGLGVIVLLIARYMAIVPGSDESVAGPTPQQPAASPAAGTPP
jgi:Ion channel